MTRYLLHGGGLILKSEGNDSYFRTIVEAVPDGGTLLVVLFAATEDRWPELFENLKGYVAAQAGEKRIAYALATREHFVEEAGRADAILIRGGSTDRLIEALRAYNDLAAVFNGKLVAGSSAGAYAFGVYNYSRSGKKLRDGLGLVKAKVLCHYESEDPKEHNGADAVAVMEAEHPELPLITLRDAEWKELTV